LVKIPGVFKDFKEILKIPGVFQAWKIFAKIPGVSKFSRMRMNPVQRLRTRLY
jgi:hypothetical protein